MSGGVSECSMFLLDFCGQFVQPGQIGFAGQSLAHDRIQNFDLEVRNQRSDLFRRLGAPTIRTDHRGVAQFGTQRVGKVGSGKHGRMGTEMDCGCAEDDRGSVHERHGEIPQVSHGEVKRLRIDVVFGEALTR